MVSQIDWRLLALIVSKLLAYLAVFAALLGLYETATHIGFIAALAVCAAPLALTLFFGVVLLSLIDHEPALMFLVVPAWISALIVGVWHG